LSYLTLYTKNIKCMIKGLWDLGEGGGSGFDDFKIIIII